MDSNIADYPLAKALEPRYLGACAIIARSFARIRESHIPSYNASPDHSHADETNCKKQGLLPLTFVDEKDYDRVQPEDRVDLIGIKELAPGSQITMKLTHKDGSMENIRLQHTFK